MQNRRWQLIDGRVMAKVLIMTIQVNLCCFLYDYPIITTISLPPWTTHLFKPCMAFLQYAHFLTAWLFWIRFQFFLQLHTAKLTAFDAAILLYYRQQCLLL